MSGGELSAGIFVMFPHFLSLHTFFNVALKDVLEKRGVLSEVRAKLRSEVYKSLDDQVARFAGFIRC